MTSDQVFMRHLCQITVSETRALCGKPSVGYAASIGFDGMEEYRIWLCAKHYDEWTVEGVFKWNGPALREEWANLGVKNDDYDAQRRLYRKHRIFAQCYWRGMNDIHGAFDAILEQKGSRLASTIRRI